MKGQASRHSRPPSQVPTAPRGSSRLRVAGVVAPLLLVPALAVWLLRPPPVVPVTGTAAAREMALQRPVVLSTAAHPDEVEESPPLVDDIPLMKPGPDDSSENGPRRPHPIGPTRLRIYRENNLVGAMNAAMDLGRYEELRELNAQYREEYPEDESVLQEAYDLIADCQEDLTDERQARAREFYKKHRSSQLRRFVRRHCRL